MKAGWKRLVEDHPSIRNLEADLKLDQASPETLRVYALAAQKFSDFLGVQDPEAALEKAKSEPERHINGFLRWVVSQGLSTNYAGSMAAGLRKWFLANDVRLDRDQIRSPSTRTVIQDEVPDVKILRRFNKNADARQRFLMTGIVSSGMRMGGFVRLKMRDLDLDLDPKIIVVYVPHRAAKGYMNSQTPDRVLYHTFMSGEAREALEDYLDHRRRILGEAVGPESPVVTGRYGPYVGEHVAYSTASRIWRELLKSTGETDKSRTWYVYHSHVLRKYFRTNCAYARVPEEFVHKWMGHVGYLEREYLRLSAERDLELYRQAEPYLTISEVAELRRDMDRRVDDLVTQKLEELGVTPEFLRMMVARETARVDRENGDSNNSRMFG